MARGVDKIQASMQNMLPTESDVEILEREVNIYIKHGNFTRANELKQEISKITLTATDDLTVTADKADADRLAKETEAKELSAKNKAFD